jgi:hypothetical protein
MAEMSQGPSLSEAAVRDLGDVTHPGEVKRCTL